MQDFFIVHIHFGWEERTGSGNYEHIAMKDLNEFKKSVSDNKGYYIGRYEAGKEGETLVVKRGVKVWNNVKQYESANLARGMYTTDVVSDLVNSYAWDTALVFIRELSGDANYPIRNSSSQNTKFETGHGFIKTGDVRCNIFDMLLNYKELTTEGCWCCSSPSVYRGGKSRMDDALHYSACARDNQNANAGYNDVTFRVVIYLPEET